jgi:hypothetical protein
MGEDGFLNGDGKSFGDDRSKPQRPWEWTVMTPLQFSPFRIREELFVRNIPIRLAFCHFSFYRIMIIIISLYLLDILFKKKDRRR